MAEKKETATEVFKINLNARGIAELRNVFSRRALQKFGSGDLNLLGLGLPDKFLQPGGEQPTLAILTVVANKLELQINLTHLDIKTFEQVKTEPENAAKPATGK